MATMSQPSPVAPTVTGIHPQICALGQRRAPEAVHPIYTVATNSAEKAHRTMQETLALIDEVEQHVASGGFITQDVLNRIYAIKAITEPLTVLIRAFSFKVLELPAVDTERSNPTNIETRPRITLRSGLDYPGIVQTAGHERATVAPLPTSTELEAQTSLERQFNRPLIPIARNELVQATWKQWLSLYGNNMLRASTELEIQKAALKIELNSIQKPPSYTAKVAVQAAFQSLERLLPKGPHWNPDDADANQWSDVDKAMQTAIRTSPIENRNQCDGILYKMHRDLPPLEETEEMEISDPFSQIESTSIQMLL